jgi:hypothetical protein
MAAVLLWKTAHHYAARVRGSSCLCSEIFFNAEPAEFLSWVWLAANFNKPEN